MSDLDSRLTAALNADPPPAQDAKFRVEVLGFGERLEAKSAEELTATARRSDLEAALAGLRERYRRDRERGLRDLGVGADVLDGHVVEAASGEQLERHPLQLLVRTLLLQLAQTGGGGGGHGGTLVGKRY